MVSGVDEEERHLTNMREAEEVVSDQKKLHELLVLTDQRKLQEDEIWQMLDVKSRERTKRKIDSIAGKAWQLNQSNETKSQNPGT